MYLFFLENNFFFSVSGAALKSGQCKKEKKGFCWTERDWRSLLPLCVVRFCQPFAIFLLSRLRLEWMPLLLDAIGGGLKMLSCSGSCNKMNPTFWSIIRTFIRIESFSNDEGNATENLTWTKRFAQLWLFYDHPFFAFYSSCEGELK